MSMRNLLQEVRSALTNYSDLTDLLPAEKITFARRPQRDQMPGITFTIGNVDYDEVKLSYAAATTYRVDVTVFGESADQTTEIHDQVKLAMLAVSSSNFEVRIIDERYFVDVDNNHQAYVSATWQMDVGLEGTSTTVLSPAMQGADKMKLHYVYDAANGQSFDWVGSMHGMYIDFTSSGGQAVYSVNLLSAETNLGKVMTVLLGENADNNTLVRLIAQTNETVETSTSYDLNRAHSAINLVAVNIGPDEYGWRIYAYHGLHD